VITDDPDHYLHNDWLAKEEIEVKRRDVQQETSIQNSQLHRLSYDHQITPHDTHVPAPGSREESEPEYAAPTTTNPSVIYKSNLPPAQVNTEPVPHSAPIPAPSGPPVVLRFSTRATSGLRQTTRYADAFLAKVATFVKDDGYESALDYKAELKTDLATGHVDIQDPRVYAAKKKDDPDAPSLYQALHGEHAEQYMEAMKKEIQYLNQQSTWKTIPRTEAKKVFKSTLVFKLRRFPDGSPSKFKARFCIRGDLQTEGVDYFETYAPVVQWSTVQLFITLVL
jgi:hypothetical protein